MTQASLQFSIPYVERDNLAAMRFHIKRTWFGPIGLRFLFILALFLSGIGMIGPIIKAELTTGLALACVVVGFLIAFGTRILVYWWTVFSCSRAVSRTFEQLALAGAYSHYSMDKDGLQIDDPVMSGSARWDALHSWMENDQMLIIYRAEHLFYFFPHSAMDPQDLSAMRSFLEASHVAKR